LNFAGSWPLALRVAVLAASVFTINLPFGAWRVRTTKRTLPWLMSIHVPIPFLFLLRRALGLSYWFIAVSLAAAILGQYLGGRAFPADSAGKTSVSR